MEIEALKFNVEKGMSIRDIAKECDVSLSTVRYWLKKHGLKTDAKDKNRQVLERACKHCRAVFNMTLHDFGNHIRWCDSNPDRKRSEALFCENCGKDTGSTRRRYCSRDCYWSSDAGKLHRKKMSDVAHERLKNNPEQHNWKGAPKSPPCEALKERLRTNGFLFEEEWTPLKDRQFALDIAWPERKLAIEVNGNQHYDENGNLTEYYQKRHDLIESAGWKILEVHFRDVYDEQFIDELINLIR